MAGGGGGFDDDDGGVISDINVTPLVDVMLVLLVVLMMPATAIVSQSIAMDLPSAQTGEATPQDAPVTVTISIDAENQLYLDRDEVDENALRRKLRELEPDDNDVRAIIAADGVVPHRSVVRVIDLLRQEKVTKFAINVRPGDLAAAEE